MGHSDMTTVFVSGPTGCIGAAAVGHLLDEGVDRVVGFSRREDFSRIPCRYHDRIRLIQGDITDAAQVRDAVNDAEPTALIHLAAFQTPDCQARPMEGLSVNVAGTLNMFRAPGLQPERADSTHTGVRRNSPLGVRQRRGAGLRCCHRRRGDVDALRL